MTEDQEQPDRTTEPESVREGPLGGERLAAARRERQISVHEVAKELHLDEAKVRALEANEFDVLGAPVFAKGHLRKYAQLVGVDEGDVFADYFKMTRTADLPPVVSKRPKIRQELSPGPWIAVVIVLIAAIVAYWWFVARPAAPAVEPPPAGAAVTDAEPLPAEPAQITTVAAAVEEPAENPADVEAEAEPAPSPEPASSPEPVAADDGLTRIALDFSGDCWTEIYDAGGERLFFDMGRGGRSVELSGVAPFDVLFGNAENVSVRVDGRDYPVVPANPGSRTARLTILRP